MKTKWYFGVLIAMLAFFVVDQQQTKLPNQEIVLEFTNTEVNSSSAKKTIAIVKQQLQRIGITNTRIVKGNEEGTLKIVYYSDTAVEFIKQVLSKTQNNGETQFPLNKNSKDYNFNVYKIQKSIDSRSDFDGKYVLLVKYELDRFSNPNLYSFVIKTETDNTDKVVKTAQKLNRTIAIAIGDSSHTIPEVRAGPIA